MVSKFSVRPEAGSFRTYQYRIGIKLIGDTIRYCRRLFRLWFSRQVEGVIKAGSFSQDNRGRWYVNLQCEVEDASEPVGYSQVGIDLGLRDQLACSDRDQPESRENLTRHYEDELAIAQRSGKKKRVKAIHATIKNVRKDWTHKATTAIAKRAKRIYVGDVSSSQLAKTKMAKSTYDAGWGMIRHQLQYKAMRLAGVCVPVCEMFSSVTCSNCLERSGPSRSVSFCRWPAIAMLARGELSMNEIPISGSYRPTIMGTQGMVSSGHYLASLAGERILARGGNAVDAGVAAGACLCVLQTDMVNFAGVAPIMVYLAASDRVTTISGLGRWPQGAEVEYFQTHCDGRIPLGVLRCVTPSGVDAWITALREYGTLSLSEVLKDAMHLASQGFPMHAFMAANLRQAVGTFSQWPSSADIFLPRGRPPEPGEIFVQRDLGRTLQRLVEAEAGARQQGREAALEAARDLFYRGDIAREIDAFYQAQGGLLTYADLAAFRVQIEEPVRVSFAEYDIYTCGPWCQGPVLAQTLALLESYDLAALGHNSPAYVHLLTEALKLGFADRERYYGDPEFVDVPMQALLSQDYAEARRQLIDPHQAQPGMPPAGDPWHGNGAAPPWNRATLVAGVAAANTLDTTYVCVVDRDGNVFSATPSDGCFGAPVTPGLGMTISTRGSQSWVVNGHASAIAPGKRPRLTPNPAIVFKNAKPFMPLGTPGGDVQCQAMLQIFLNVAVFGMSPQAAIEAPRFATFSHPGSFEPHDYLPDEVRIERRLAASVGNSMAQKGHQVVIWPDWTWRAGAVCAIEIDRDKGIYKAGADPRRMSYAIGW
ncbi:hypothetical protein NKDENANG_00307 [Candidatus Entotheonellaceae bacterium PAL068K]